MNKQYNLFIIIFLLLPTVGMPKNFNHNISDKDLVIKVFGYYKTIAPTFNLTLRNVVFTDNESSHVSNGDPDINVQLSQIQEFTKDSSADFKRLFIEFMLAHEIGHKIQFGGYHKDVITQTKGGEGTIFLECNADILGGFIMISAMNTVEMPELTQQNPSFDFESYNQNNLIAMNSVYKKIFEMDQLNTNISTHPNNLQRLLATREGVILGNYVAMKFADISKSNQPPEKIKQYQTTLKDLSKTLGFTTDKQWGDNPLVWAHLEAIRITNENNLLAKNLIRFDKQDEREYGDDPYSSFSFKIYNKNSVPIRFAGRVLADMHPPYDNNDYTKHYPLDGMVFDTTIGANEVAEISGRLKIITEPDYVTDIVMPGDKGSAFFVFDSQHYMTDQEDRESENSDFSEWNDQSLSNVDDHIKAVDFKRSDFFKYAKGIGVSMEAQQGRLSQHLRRFQPSFKGGMQDDQYFTYFESSHQMDYHFNACSLPDANKVKQHFYDINEKTQKSFANKYTAQAVEEQNTNLSQSYFDANGKKVIMIKYQKDFYKRGNYCVAVTVYGSDGK